MYHTLLAYQSQLSSAYDVYRVCTDSHKVGFIMSAAPMEKWQMKFQLAHEGVYNQHGILHVAGSHPPQASKRFETTSKSATEYVKSRLHEVPNREEVSLDLRRRKMNNTRTNIDMGSDDPQKWVTDALEGFDQSKILWKNFNIN